jgi:hypothetical protein
MLVVNNKLTLVCVTTTSSIVLCSVIKTEGDYHACADQAVVKSPFRRSSGNRTDGTAILTYILRKYICRGEQK